MPLESTAAANSQGLGPGRLIVVSGPSGAGKTTLLKRMFAECRRPLVASVSATTRRPRPGEVDGVDYHFLSAGEFARRRAAGEFLECCEVFTRGDWYGTLLSEVTPSLAAGKWVVLEIDVQGTLAVLERYPDAVTIFVLPASYEELERRLRDRGTESEDALARRLATARRELISAPCYRFRVVNDDLDRAVHEMCQIMDNC
ncbi:MAG TPA: guanylate kinase [Pirellulales bacterium]|jgi:guanylate kinase|nr:guanylate kinase [Pirellulales bacterium]